MKKILAIVLAVGLLISLLLSGCGDSNSGKIEQTTTAAAAAATTATPEVIDPFGKFSPEIELSIALNGASSAKFPEGDSYENNVWTRSLKEDLGINTKIMVIYGDNYETKVNLFIASNQLPDLFHTKNYTQFDRLVKSNRAADLTEVYDKYASPLLKQWYEEDSGMRKSWGTINGKLYGYAKTGVNYQTTRMVHIRRDWFEQTKLPKPKTMEDVIAIARTIKAQDPANRFGLTFTQKFNPAEGGLGDMVGIANSLGVFPRVWHEADGKLVYGSIQPGMKKVLELYSQFFKEGLIDPEFAVKDSNKVAEDLANNKIGVIIGNWYVYNFPLVNLYKTGGVEWDAYPLPAMSDPDIQPKVQTDSPLGEMYVLKNGYAKPEALIKL